MEFQYTFDEASRIVQHYAPALVGRHLRTQRTPNLHWLEGQVQEAVALPFDRATKAYERFVWSYQQASNKPDWLKARQREAHAWLPFVRLDGQYIPLLPVLAEQGLWTEDWRG
jgi:hypothetical protein